MVLVCGDMWMWSDGYRSATALLAALLLLLTTSRPVKSHHFRRTCHSTYYAWPDCVDHPQGYRCECGPGFFWNTKMCVALGIDSSLEFAQSKPVRYTMLLNKPFPRLEAFTMTMWLKVSSSDHPGTVFSYIHNNNRSESLALVSGPSISLVLLGEPIFTDIVVNSSTWFHLTWTWTSRDGSWFLYINGREVLRGRGHAHHPVSPGGELVLGQLFRTPDNQDYFDLDKAFLGEMGFVNIWESVLSRQAVYELANDCFFKACGDAVQWADFRSGTRGAMKMRWPAHIQGAPVTPASLAWTRKLLTSSLDLPLYKVCIGYIQRISVASSYEDEMANHIQGAEPCFSSVDVTDSCDKYCSHVIGAQCRAQVASNVLWGRTAADTNLSVPCPGRLFLPGEPIFYANRTCLRISEYEGVWEDPVMDDCISKPALDMKHELGHMKTETGVNMSEVLDFASALFNSTLKQAFVNPVDISAVLDSVHVLLKAQGQTSPDLSMNKTPQRYTRTHQLFPHFHDTESFSEMITGTLDELLREQNSPGWLATVPLGSEGDKLLSLLEEFFTVIYQYLQTAVLHGQLLLDQARISADMGKIDLQTQLFRTDDLIDITYPINPARSHFGTLSLPKEGLFHPNSTLPDYVGVSIARIMYPSILPNHDVKRKSKEDNVNSAIFSLYITSEDYPITNFSVPVRLHLPYFNDFNVSNPVCVRLKHGGLEARWQWESDGCHLVSQTKTGAECECYTPGVYAVTTDMYDVNWDPGEDPNPLMLAPSYVGCSLSAVLCLISFIMLIYLRTSSGTAAIHKNFALSVVCCQVVFMAGIDKFHHLVVCHVFAILFHYFFLSTFSWLMNEAFNLYIVITYAAHSHTDQEGGSQWRYYILGWILPGVLVGAFVGTHTDDYYAIDMCWIAWDYLWLFLGPAIGIISVTLLVLVFTAKEQHESAYAKSEETNKMISIHTKALWTQVILLTICWSFAFLTLKMKGIIIKYLYAMFNTLQGAFFLVFYFLLNDEVRAVLSAHRKRKSMEKKFGYDYSGSGSLGSDEELQELGENHIEMTETVAETPSAMTNHKKRNSQANKRRHQRSQIEVSSDEASDTEMMITSV